MVVERWARSMMVAKKEVTVAMVARMLAVVGCGGVKDGHNGGDDGGTMENVVVLLLVVAAMMTTMRKHQFDVLQNLS
ncbi:hypothetical protein D8674_022013 [Pyrus ussuriensis x Pyrus communis]|uniref:Uncharacterized protein n=1 Tax=Pyrus ussuriensis x Pyrus communis TaxID=2448454 RepID=A0A5N5GIS3_9ROSA|nr:hypothetical protein D8674_022013 [Pyrus ussuriensis x Pyrus communis]